MLQDLLATNIFDFLLVFSRLSLVFFLFPGISAGYVPARLRLIVALLVTLLALPLVHDELPPQPGTPAELASLIVTEMLIGGFLGAVVQTIMSTLQLAGEVIAQSTGLTNALVDDPVTEEQSAIVIGLLDIVAVLMIFITGSHHLLISAAVDSYSLLHPGGTLFAGDMLSMASTLLGQSYAMGIRLAAPFLVFEMVFQITSGIMARLSPQLNVYFVAMPGQIALGLSILMITLPTIMLVFMRYFDENIRALLNPVAGG
ncbi:MAG: flagellar type III secretion system protein FliR [Rhodospirillaceae bacterium]|nr:MAG: flagellar type III secretion system protein FliR [Rhodospirillaceae bacterium]